MTVTEQTQYAELFKQYLDVCNQALTANKDRFPFKHILEAADNAAKPKNVEVRIIDDKPDRAYVIRLEDQRILGEGHQFCQNCDCDGYWNVPRSYLENVVQNPEDYIANPAKINWDWMYGHQA